MKKSIIFLVFALSFSPTFSSALDFGLGGGSRGSGGGITGLIAAGNFPLATSSTTLGTSNMLQDDDGNVVIGAPVDPDITPGHLTVMNNPVGDTQTFGVQIGSVYRGTGTLAALARLYITGYNADVGNMGSTLGTYTDIENYGGGDATEMAGHYTFLSNDSDGTTGALKGFWLDAFNVSGTVTDYYGHYAGLTGTLVGTAYHFYGKDLASTAPNAYYEWFDSRGVYRIREDSSFDSVGQAIPALYNPQFAKYTPGAADFERGEQRWNANVFEMGAIKGGTGTQRKTKILGAGLLLETVDTGSASTGKVLCYNTSTKVVWLSSTTTACDN